MSDRLLWDRRGRAAASGACFACGLLVALCMPTGARGQSERAEPDGAQGFFDEAQRAALDGDQAQAAALFARALNGAGGEHPAVYHGLGNALFRQADIGGARCAYARGLALAPRDGDLRANLERVSRAASDQLDPPPVPYGVFFWTRLLSSLELGVLGSALATAGLSLTFAARLRGRPVGAGAIGALLLALVCGGSAALVEASPGAVVITADEVTARSSRGPDGVELFRLHAGAAVQVADHAPDGVLVQLPDGRKGWVPLSATCSTKPGTPFSPRS